LTKDYPVETPWKNGVPASALETSLEPFGSTVAPVDAQASEGATS